MDPSKEFKEKIDRVRKEAEEALKKATKETDAKYHPFISRIEKDIRVELGHEVDLVTVEVPYMRVDGRVCMCRDDHEIRRSPQPSIITEFIQIQHGQSTIAVCRATITSDLIGTKTGHAKVPISDFGAEKTNPLECAETSAIGRALGFAGYGVLSTGIASFEEMQTALAEDEAARNPVVFVPMTTPQKRMISVQFSTLGISDETEQATLASNLLGLTPPITSIDEVSKAKASTLIDALKQKIVTQNNGSSRSAA